MPHPPTKPVVSFNEKTRAKEKAKKIKARRSRPPGFQVRTGFSLQRDNNFNKLFLRAEELTAQEQFFRTGGGFEQDLDQQNREKRARRLRKSLEGISFGQTPPGLEQRGLTLLSEHLRLG